MENVQTFEVAWGLHRRKKSSALRDTAAMKISANAGGRFKAYASHQGEPPVHADGAAFVPSVLIADDEPALSDLLAHALRRETGMQCHAVPNGEAAIRALQQSRYDAIVSDLEMPGVDGKGLYHWVASNRPELAERFVFHTGCSRFAFLEAPNDFPGVPVFLKPSTVAELADAVSTMLQLEAATPAA